MNLESQAHSPSISPAADHRGSSINDYSGISGSAETSCCEVDSELMDNLVRDVRRLSETLTDLGFALDQPASSSRGLEKSSSSQSDRSSQEGECGGWSVNVHHCLCNVLQVLKEAIIRYRFLQSNDIFEHIGSLVEVIKGLKFDEDAPENVAALRKAHSTLENLQIAVAECVGEYLTWEMTHYDTSVGKRSWSAEDLSTMTSTGERPVAKKREKKLLRKQLSVGSETPLKSRSAIDYSLDDEENLLLLGKLDNGVEIALSRARVWSNYCKEVLNYVQRRINLESEHARAVQKLNVNARLNISIENFLPLGKTYLNCFQLENDFYDQCLDTMRHLYEYKFIRPLEARKADIDAKRKDLKHCWEKCVKEMDNALLELRKARQNVVIRESNYKRARDNLVKSENLKADVQKTERRRRMQEEAFTRREQATQDYWSLQRRIDEKYEEMTTLKTNILQQVRELIYQCDQTTKACTVAYLQEMANLVSVIPPQYMTLAENARQYIPGTLYKEYVQKATAAAGRPSEECKDGKGKTASESELPLIQVNGDPVGKRNDLAQRCSYPSSPTSTSSTKYETDSSLGQSVDLKMPRAAKGKALSRPSVLSDAALSHRLQKIMAPCKCCHCESYTFFQTVGCSEVGNQCGLNWHKTCLDNVSVHCQLAKQLKLDNRRMCIFGVPLQRHLEETHTTLPYVLTSCIEELERKGLNTKGLYRVCGVKSCIEQICEKFERQKIELSSVLPTNIASIIKLYLRQLPEPLLTHALYDPFVQVAKKYPANKRVDSGKLRKSIIDDLKYVCRQLPSCNYLTLKLLCLHLNRVSWFESENQMSTANLGIVFGPSLLWTNELLSRSSLKSLLDAPLQTRVVEFLIKHAYEIFDENPKADMSRLGIATRSGHLLFEYDSKMRRNIRSMDPLTDEQPCHHGQLHLTIKNPNSATPDLLRDSKIGRTRSVQDSIGGPVNFGRPLDKTLEYFGAEALLLDDSTEAECDFNLSPNCAETTINFK